ncbi:MAG: hypothetical protein KDI13_11010 [Alphaproteobacteria bacterium]|nr:hypothetical protein [Alphaproteobacteria bacterium]
MKIADWKDVESYSHLLIPDFDVNRHVWAWEFLRRNKKYQEDWLKFSELKQAYEPKYGKNWGRQEQAKIYVPPKRDGENVTQWSLRVMNESGAEPMDWEPEIFYRHKWHVVRKFLPGPTENLMEDSIFNVSYREFPQEIKYPFDTKKYTLVDESNADLSDFQFLPTDELQNDKLILVFDLNGQMNQQLKAAKKLFKKRYTKTKGHHNEEAMFLTYIRLLDAQDAFIPQTIEWGKVAEILCPNEENEHPDYLVSGRLQDNLVKAKSLSLNPYSLLSGGI